VLTALVELWLPVIVLEHRHITATHCNTLQHTETHCNTTLCNTLQHVRCWQRWWSCTHGLLLCLNTDVWLPYIATHCNTTHCNTLQHARCWQRWWSCMHCLLSCLNTGISQKCSLASLCPCVRGTCTYKSHTWMIHVTRMNVMNDSCHTYKRNMSHIWIQHWHIINMWRLASLCPCVRGIHMFAVYTSSYPSTPTIPMSTPS